MCKKKVVENTLLVIVGPDNDYLDTLKKMAEHNGTIIFPGPLYEKEKIQAYVDSTVVVVPSRYDTFPGVILEAFSAAKPVIASDVGSLPDIVHHNKTGFVFEQGNVTELSNFLLKILKDPGRTSEMGQLARDLVKEKYTSNVISDIYEEVFNKIYTKKS